MAKKGDGMTKVEMVRDAIGKLGWKAKTTELQAYIKQTHGADMTIGHISQTKSAERRRQGVKSGRKRGRPRKDETAAAAAVATGSASIADILAFVESLKSFEAKLGSSSFREVVKTVVKK